MPKKFLIARSAHYSNIIDNNNTIQLQKQIVISFQEPYNLNCGEQILIYKKKKIKIFIAGQSGNSENNSWAVSEKDKVTFMFCVIFCPC